ncbi:MAG: 2-C-methyl-D-erythritol 2,4-cyclodiphosphate synthase [Gammaproteobacteria bacterium]|nr:2-C-methyl-D-erythritol 2,4-cyclodiphosphate synthase [Gammaproteobacteria bacterium]
MRIGQGFDAHRFGDETGEYEIMLGGCSIPHDRALIAHSDGDVAIHALVDALLGALALGDIGAHFPDQDPAFQGIDSRELLRAAYQKVTAAGYVLGNADITIIAEKPRIGSHADDMRRILATDLDADVSQVSIKATTTEKMGYLGREEGIAAQAIVLLESAGP